MQRLHNVPDQFKPIIRSIRKKARKYGVQIIFEVKDDLVYESRYDTEGVTGYFSGLKKTMALSCNGDPYLWFPLLAHESSHMDQWIENKKWYDQLELAYGSMENWLLGNRVGRKELQKAFIKIIEGELDCEKRAIEKIKKWGVQVNLDILIQKANAYVYRFLYVMETRKWKSPNAAQHVAIWNKAPKEFQQDYTVIPEQLREQFEKHLN